MVGEDMRDVAGFAAFVAARWGTLYRLAYLLTGTCSAAEELLQTALTNAYVRWPQIRKLDPPDAGVRQTLLRAFLSEHQRESASREPPGGHLDMSEDAVDPAMLDHELLWALVCALPTPQRAVMVLRHHEDVGDEEIAALLGCTRTTVESYAFTATEALSRGLAVLDSRIPRRVNEPRSLDDRVRTVLDREGNEVEVRWPPPVDALLVAGTGAARQRGARRWRVGLGAFLVLVVAATAALATARRDHGHEDASVVSTPGLRLQQLPVGAPPSSLYCLDGLVRWGTHLLAMEDGDCAWPDRFAQAGDTAIAVDSAASTLTLFVGDESHQLPAHVDSRSSPVVVSPDGSIVAWVSAQRVDGRQQVVLWDTTNDREWHRLQVPTSDPLNLEGIDSSGRVYLTSVRHPNRAVADRIWVWPGRNDGEFQEVVGLGDFVTVADVAPHLLAVLKTVDGGDESRSDDRGISGIAVWGTVTEDGDYVLGPAGRVQWVVWAPNRSRYLAVASLRVVEQPGPSDVGVKIRLPTDVQIAGVPSWESNDQLLVPVETHLGPAATGAVLRCSARTAACEVAARWRHDVRLPGDDADNLS